MCDLRIRAGLLGFTTMGFIAAWLIARPVAVTEQRPGETVPLKRWYKGNLHAHTLNSDGDSSPRDVAAWYRDHGYDFLVLSDHDVITDTSSLQHNVSGRLLLIPGEEVTDAFNGKPVHVSAVNPASVVHPAHGNTLVETIENNLEMVRKAGGLPSLNHPNYRWAITSAEMLQLRDLPLLEVYNGHPEVNNAGVGGGESVENMWDALLTAGRRTYGVAVDDAHDFKRIGKTFSNPGRGWVMVKAGRMTRQSIMAAIAAGNFYASTGVELNAISFAGGELRVEIATTIGGPVTTYFIGAGGEVLGRSCDRVATYRFRGGEKYVRARVEGSGTQTAWTQAFAP